MHANVRNIYSQFNGDQLHMLVQLPTEHILVKNKNAHTYRQKSTNLDYNSKHR